MMKTLRNAKIITIILHGFITIAAGHGMILMLLCDVLLPFYLLSGEIDIDFTLTNDYTSRISSAIIASFIGKIILILSFFVKIKQWKQWSTNIGFLLLLFSFGLLTCGDWSYDSIFILSFASGIPFLLYLGRVLYLTYHAKNHLV